MGEFWINYWGIMWKLHEHDEHVAWKVVGNQMATGPQGVEANEAETCGLPLEGYECLSWNREAAVRFRFDMSILLSKSLGAKSRV